MSAGTTDPLLPVVLNLAEKRALDLIADWPWIASGDLAALLGVSASRLSRVLSRLEELGLGRQRPAHQAAARARRPRTGTARAL